MNAQLHPQHRLRQPSLLSATRGNTCCGDRALAAGACFSADGRYRYLLWRTWNPKGPTVVFVLLNPSDAAEYVEDATSRRCFAHSKALGAGSFEIVNPFPIVSSSPAKALRAKDRDGEEDGEVNARHIRAALQRADRVIVGFGTPMAQKRNAPAYNRLAQIFHELDLLEPLPMHHALDHRPFAYALVGAGGTMPKHPLYVAVGTKLQPYRFVPIRERSSAPPTPSVRVPRPSTPTLEGQTPLLPLRTGRRRNITLETLA